MKPVKIIVFISIVLLFSLTWMYRGNLISGPAEKAPVETAVPPPAPAVGPDAPQPHGTGPDYLGSEACATCHASEYREWQDSHHYHAMQPASAETVLGNFENTPFKDTNIESHFFSVNGKYYIRSTNPDGESEEFQVTHTFGYAPLQQYLVDFPGGRKQVYPVAWDSEKEEWFFVQADLAPRPGEWVHWTGGAMNWNGMCADCHSTAVKKHYKRSSNVYKTEFAAVNVDCEACHGPASRHLDNIMKGKGHEGGAADLDMHTATSPAQLVDQCGRCHARRQTLTAMFRHNGGSLLDHYLPAVLRRDLYHADGQIQEEVFVYGSYLQSRHYQYGVKCTDCHNPHSGKLRATGNGLCTGCHAAEVYDDDAHHHHAAVAESADNGSGVQCVDCHMPGRYYMVRDFRRDHSFRVPRPDLSVRYATPNACSNCHQDRGAEWASAAINQWYGPERRAHFSDQLASTGTNAVSDVSVLSSLLRDLQQPVIVRATAAHMLGPLVHEPRVEEVLADSLDDSAPLLRTYAARALWPVPVADRRRLLTPLLDDPVRAVRVAAAGGLLELDPASFAAEQRSEYLSARVEYLASVNSSADLPSGRFQLALDYHRQGQLALAEKAYLATIDMDRGFNAARLNLAQLYYQQGRLEEVETLYRTVIRQEPDAYQAYYSLGLLMAELGKMDAAGQLLEKAAGLGDFPRAWYNLAVFNHQQDKIAEAETAYIRALQASPLDEDFLQGLVSLYAQQQQWSKLEGLIERTLALSPNHPHLRQLQQSIEQLREKNER